MCVGKGCGVPGGCTARARIGSDPAAPARSPALCLSPPPPTFLSLSSHTRPPRPALLPHPPQECTAFVGNLDAATSEALVWELFAQAGPVASVYLPKDRVTGEHQGYGFVEFRSPPDAEYAARVLNMVRLYGKPLRVTRAGAGGEASEEEGEEG